MTKFRPALFSAKLPLAGYWATACVLLFFPQLLAAPSWEDSLLATTKYKAAVGALEKELVAHPKDARYYSALSLALASAGEEVRVEGIGVALTWVP